MIKYDVLNRFTGDVQFTAEIDCDEKASESLKLGLAVKWAVKNKANLQGANLEGANLRDANLQVANLGYANLEGANLGEANLGEASLRYASLRYANLRYANLQGANLQGANLRGTNLEYANLWGANLWGANLRYANLCSTLGNRKHIKSLQLDKYDITYTADVMHIGCENHAIKDWWAFDDERIDRMDKCAPEWWVKWKPVLQNIIEASPAEPTGYKEQENEQARRN